MFKLGEEFKSPHFTEQDGRPGKVDEPSTQPMVASVILVHTSALANLGQWVPCEVVDTDFKNIKKQRWKQKFLVVFLFYELHFVLKMEKIKEVYE